MPFLLEFSKFIIVFHHFWYILKYSEPSWTSVNDSLSIITSFFKYLFPSRLDYIEPIVVLSNLPNEEGGSTFKFIKLNVKIRVQSSSYKSFSAVASFRFFFLPEIYLKPRKKNRIRNEYGFLVNLFFRLASNMRNTIKYQHS